MSNEQKEKHRDVTYTTFIVEQQNNEFKHVKQPLFSLLSTTHKNANAIINKNSKKNSKNVGTIGDTQ